MLLQQMIEEFIRNWIAAIERMIQQFFASVQSSRCRVLRINGQKVSGRMRGRRLLSLNRKLQDSEIDVEYELDLVAVCSGSECSDAQSVKEISNSVYNQVTSKLDEAITDGSLIQEIRDSSSAEIAGVLENGELFHNMMCIKWIAFLYITQFLTCLLTCLLMSFM